MKPKRTDGISWENSGSLTFVGTGYLLAGHVTAETIAHIKNADKVFMLANTVTENWIKALNPSAESLSDAYGEGKQRLISYREMVDRILAPVGRGARVCTVVYGHPGVFVMASRQAIRQARRDGYTARMLPAVSAEDCLFADLALDPAQNGCQSFEATDFLIHQRPFDPASCLVLWQVGTIGVSTYEKNKFWSLPGLEILVERLLESYPAAHEVVVYSTSGLPIGPPRINRVPLAQLAESELSVASTLWVPPRERAKLDEKMLTRLSLPLAEDPAPVLSPLVAKPSAPRGRLTIVGTGYKVAGQVGAQARGYIEMVDRLFYLATDPATAYWLESLNSTARSLADCYREGESSAVASREMVARILDAVREGLHVGVAFSGHPAIGLWTSHQAFRQAREEGHTAKMLPAVSFEDCLIADLGVDPSRGRAMYAATDFLIRPRLLDPASALVLLQVGVIGETQFRKSTSAVPEQLRLLREFLARHYPAEHPVTLYDIGLLPPFEPTVHTLPLAQLSQAQVSVNSTLYIPPREAPVMDSSVAERLRLASAAPR